MRRILFLLTMALMSVCVMAQEKLPYDEELLLGSWMSDGNYMEIGDGSHGPIPVGCISLMSNHSSYISYSLPTGGYTQYEFTAFFVSDTDKLHLISKMPTQWHSVTFVIKWLEYDRNNNQCILHLRPLGSSKSDDYLFYRSGGINSVTSAKTENSSSNRKYSLSGAEVDNPEGIYVQNGKKYIAK